MPGADMKPDSRTATICSQGLFRRSAPARTQRATAGTPQLVVKLNGSLTWVVMRKTAAIVAALATGFSSGPARAQPASSKLAATFGNTILSTYPDGRSQKIWMKPDGTWTGLSRRGSALAGKWTLKGEKVCLRQTSPPTLPISFCQVLPDNAAKGIDAKDVIGRPIHLELVAGHVTQGSG